MICGAWGGRPDKDGLEAVTNASQNLSNMPVEVMEAEHPVRIEDYSFVPDSCGAGQYRGGVGVRRSYRILAPEALLQLRTDRVTFQPYGLNGGEPGGSSRNFIEVGNERNALPGKITMTVARDTLIIHEQAGAGGFGNPLLREPEQVREDFLDGKITAAFAERHYAVRFGARGALDVEATARLRSRRVSTPAPSGTRHGA
jgi:N-methylhydantoinase B